MNAPSSRSIRFKGLALGIAQMIISCQCSLRSRAVSAHEHFLHASAQESTRVNRTAPQVVLVDFDLAGNLHTPSGSRLDLNLMQGDQGEMEPPKDMLYHHLAKTGITTTVSLLQAAIPNLETQPAYQSAVEEEHKFKFLVGTIRNPCDYYVSLWSYSASHPSHLYHELAHDGAAGYIYNGVSEGKDRARDIRSFRNFLAHISGIGAPGLGAYSGRIAYAYVPNAGLSGDFSMGHYTAEQLQNARTMLSNFNPDDVDCWVDTENIFNDIRACLQRYEAKLGGRVSWADFNTTVSSQELDTNPSTHLPCKAYYDKTTEALVRKMDDQVFQKFGFTSCCDEKSPFGASMHT